VAVRLGLGVADALSRGRGLTEWGNNMKGVWIVNILKAMGVAMLVLLYFISPIDVLPDVAPPFTWLDDGGILCMGLKKIGSLLSGKSAAA
jgi:hypothetical protein